MNIINEDTLYMYYDITVVRKEAASYNSLLSQLSLQYSESCELSLRFLCSGHCLEQFIIADSAKQFRLRMRSSLFY